MWVEARTVHGQSSALGIHSSALHAKRSNDLAASALSADSGRGTFGGSSTAHRPFGSEHMPLRRLKSSPLAYAHALELIETFELRRSQEAAAAALRAEADSEFTAPLERQSAYGPGPKSIPADPLCFLPARELSIIRDGLGLK